jgi:uncharacterized protein
MKIGQKGTDRGLLIFLAVDDHKRQIITGYGLEGILPDGKVGDIGREMVPDLRANDYDGAVTLAVTEAAQVIAADAKITLTDDAPVAERQPLHHGQSSGKIIFLIIWLAFFFGSAILRLIFGRRGRLLGGSGVWWIGSGGGGGGFGGGDSGGGGGGFGGFGGGDTGGGGAGGSW